MRRVTVALCALFLTVPNFFILPANRAFAQQPPGKSVASLKITKEQFGKLALGFSEKNPGAYGLHNPISNEFSYLHPFPWYGHLRAKEGWKDREGKDCAYIGVGPEQNFSYAAKLRPCVVIVVDIQPQNFWRMLMYKAMFEESETRADFVRMLIARHEDTVEKLLTSSQPGDTKVAKWIMDCVFRKIESYGIKLTEENRELLRQIHAEFVQHGGAIRSGTGPMQPTLEQLVFAKDDAGMPGSYLALEENYAFVRQMQISNLIIPVIGNFGGKHAFKKIAEWLKEHGLFWKDLYASSVAYHIHDEGEVWLNWLENFERLPRAEVAYVIHTIPFKRNHANNPDSRPDFEWMTLVMDADDYVPKFRTATQPSDFAKHNIRLRQSK